MLTRMNILGIPVDSIAIDELISKLLEWAKSDTKKTVTYCNPNSVNIALHDAHYKSILKKMDLIYADGIGLVWASRILNCPLITKINTLDFFDEFAKKAKDSGTTFYFLGAKREVVEQAVKNVRGHYGLHIAGFHQGYFDKSQEQQIIKEINDSRPDILLVGMGIPRQEEWIINNFSKLNVKLIWAVGGVFRILSGELERAPHWLIALGLEWFFRLCQEPLRLWRRYLIGNPLFVFRVFRERLKKIFDFCK